MKRLFQSEEVSMLLVFLLSFANERAENVRRWTTFLPNRIAFLCALVDVNRVVPRKKRTRLIVRKRKKRSKVLDNEITRTTNALWRFFLHKTTKRAALLRNLLQTPTRLFLRPLRQRHKRVSCSLGLTHDGDETTGNACKEEGSRGSVMAPMVAATFHHFYWSPCSKKEFHRRVR